MHVNGHSNTSVVLKRLQWCRNDHISARVVENHHSFELGFQAGPLTVVLAHIAPTDTATLFSVTLQQCETILTCAETNHCGTAILTSNIWNKHVCTAVVNMYAQQVAQYMLQC